MTNDKIQMPKVIFLDRDGVINKDPGGWTEYNYVTNWEEFIFLPGAIEALKKLNDAGYEIIVISNQAGINKGYYKKAQLDDITNKMLKEIEKNGARLKKVYYCVHQDSDNCDCRKPKAGLFRQAEKELGVKSAGNYFIGDAKMDIETGQKMDLKTVLLLSGKTSLEMMKSWDMHPDFIFDDLQEAVDFILKGEQN